MKPTKNRYMCPASGRVKMLFDSESSARTFIKFNKDEIYSYGKELRPYYCKMCCGWHITHVEYNEKYDRIDEIIDGLQEKSKSKNSIKNNKLESILQNLNMDTFISHSKTRKWVKSNYEGKEKERVASILGRIRQDIFNDRMTDEVLWLINYYCPGMTCKKFKEILINEIITKN